MKTCHTNPLPFSIEPRIVNSIIHFIREIMNISKIVNSQSEFSSFSYRIRLFQSSMIEKKYSNDPHESFTFYPLSTLLSFTSILFKK